MPCLQKIDLWLILIMMVEQLQRKQLYRKMDYKVYVEHGKIRSMILYLVDSIVKLKGKHNKRLTRVT